MSDFFSDIMKNGALDCQTALFTGVIENLLIGKLAERMDVSRFTANRHKIQIGDILFQTLAKDLGVVNGEGKPTLTSENSEGFQGIT